MKLWEVIKELTEDPTKKFEQREPDWVETIGCEDGFLIYASEFRGELIDRGGITENADLNESDWQLVRQPVTWQEAIEAWGAGRIVSVVVGGYKYKLTHDDSIFGLSERMINLGTWYVED